MATIVKDGDVWRVQIKRLGVRDSGTFDSKQEAKDWVAKRETEIIESGGIKGGLKSCTVQELFDKYLTTISIHKKGGKIEKKRLKYFSEVHPVISDLVKSKVKVSAVTRANIACWRDERLKQVGVGSVLREKNLLCHIFSKAEEWGLIEKSPFVGVRWPSEPQARDRRISDDEINRMLVWLDNWDRVSKPESEKQVVAAMFLVAIESAMRLSEVKLLETQEVFINERVVRIRAERLKENAKKTVGLSPEAIRILLLCKTGQFYWFGSKNINTDYIFRTARRKAGIKDLRFHDTRHEGITRLSSRLTPFQLSRTVGHTDLNRTMKYYNEKTEDFVDRF